jgi:tryptophan-rich sensory protein
LMMTFAIWIYWHNKKRDMNTVYIYFIHLVFNTTWSIVFFVLHNMLLALVILVILIVLIIILIFRFRRVNLVSSYLMIPYVLWCTFALVLNLNLILLN